MAFLIPGLISGIGSIFSGIGAGRAQAAQNRGKERQAAKIADVARMLQRNGGTQMHPQVNIRDIDPRKHQVNTSRYNIKAPHLESFRKLERRYDNANLDRAANRNLARAGGAMTAGAATRGFGGSGVAEAQRRMMTGDVIADLSQQISQNDLARLGMHQQHDQFRNQQVMQGRLANQDLGARTMFANQQVGMQGAMANQGADVTRSQMAQHAYEFQNNNRLRRAQALAGMYGHEGFALPDNDPWAGVFGGIGGAGQAIGGAAMGMYPYVPEAQKTTGIYGGFGTSGGQMYPQMAASRIPMGGQGYRRR